MNITDIRIKLLNTPKNNVYATADVIIDNELAIHGVKVIKTGEKTFVSMPSEKIESKNKKSYQDIVHPITQEGREKFTKAVLEKYELVLAESGE